MCVYLCIHTHIYIHTNTHKVHGGGWENKIKIKIKIKHIHPLGARGGLQPRWAKSRGLPRRYVCVSVCVSCVNVLCVCTLYLPNHGVSRAGSRRWFHLQRYQEWRVRVFVRNYWSEDHVAGGRNKKISKT